MKILIIGGTGTVGGAISHHLSKYHDLIIASRNSGDVRVDITDSLSIRNMFIQTGKIDGVINASGEAKWANFSDLTEEDYYIGIRSKMMGQVNLVRLGMENITTGGFVTLTTGILADRPVPMTASAAMVNGAIHSFVRAAAIELAPVLRINAVSAGLVQESVVKYGPYFPGHIPVSMSAVVKAYAESVSGGETGEIIRVY